MQPNIATNQVPVPTVGAPTDPYSSPDVVQAQNNAATATQNYGTATSNAQSMPDLLKQALNSKFASADNPLYGQQKSALADYLGATNTGYQSVLPQNNNGMIFSPASQQEQIQGRQNAALTNLSGINSLIGGGFGGISNIIDSATKTYQAEQTAAQFAAQAATQKYQDLISKIDKQVAQGNNDRAFNESQREFNLNYGLDQAKLGQTPAVLNDQLVNDLKGRMTLKDALTKYAGKIDPNDIYNIYNTVNSQPGGYGPAKESGDVLSQLGITQNPTQLKAQQAEEDKQNSISGLFSLKDTYNQINPVEKVTGFGSGYTSYNSQLQGTIDQIAKNFGISRSNPAIMRLLNAFPSAGVGSAFSDSKFQGALKGFLVTQGYLLVKDKQGNVGSIPSKEFDPKLYTKI